MDLIHEDSNHAMLGAIDRYELDLAFGSDENDFECTMAISDHCCSIGDYLAMQERGGLPARFRKGTGRTALYMGQAWYAEMVG